MSARAGTPLVAALHPAFHFVGGAEVLVLRQLAALRAPDLALRLVTRRVEGERWAARFAALDLDVRVVPRRWWERHVDRSPARRHGRAAERVAPHLADAACVVAYNHPASVTLGTLRPAARSVWQCNEPPRDLHFPEVTRRAVAELRALAEPPAVTLLPGRGPKGDRRPPDGGELDVAPDRSIDLAWTAGRLAWRARHLADPAFAAERALDVAAVGRLDDVVAISDYTAETARQVYGCRVPPIVPAPAAVPRRQGLARSGGGLQLLTHTRLEPLKNVDAVLRGFARFRGRVAGDHRLHVVGTGSLAPALRRAADALGLGDAVRWHGFLPDAELAAVYAACDVVAFLPFDEPFGMVLPEAALGGLLCIGSDHGGPAEILDGGALGPTVPPLDAEALADALEATWRLSDAGADARRARLVHACRGRYAADVVGPRLRRALLG